MPHPRLHKLLPMVLGHRSLLAELPVRQGAMPMIRMRMTGKELHPKPPPPLNVTPVVEGAAGADEVLPSGSNCATQALKRRTILMMTMLSIANALQITWH